MIFTSETGYSDMTPLNRQKTGLGDGVKRGIEHVTTTGAPQERQQRPKIFSLSGLLMSMRMIPI